MHLHTHIAALFNNSPLNPETCTFVTDCSVVSRFERYYFNNSSGYLCGSDSEVVLTSCEGSCPDADHLKFTVENGTVVHKKVQT